jgi:hypothetical protein
MAALRYAKAVRTGKEGYDVLIAIKQPSFGTPRKDNAPRCAAAQQNVVVILWDDGIVCIKETGRVGGPIGEKIDENQAAEAPLPREFDASSNRGIILNLICGRWVQSDEHDACKFRIPDSGEGKSVRAAWRKNGGAVHGASPHCPGEQLRWNSDRTINLIILLRRGQGEGKGGFSEHHQCMEEATNPASVIDRSG